MFTYRSLVPGFFVLVAGVLFFGSPAYACPQGMVCAPGKSCPPEENCVAASAPPPATAPAVNSGQAPEVREQDQEQDQGEHQLQDDNLRIETERGARELLEGDQPLPQGPVQRTYDTGTISGQIGNIQQALPQGEAAVATESALPTVSMVLTPTFTSVIEAAIKPATASCQLDSPHGSGVFMATNTFQVCPVPETAIALFPGGVLSPIKCCNVGSYPGLLPSTGLSYGSGAGVYLHSGEFYVYETDLEVPGRGLNWSFARKYRSGVISDGPLGHNWSFNYGQRLILVTERNRTMARPASGSAAIGDVLRVDGYGRVDHYRANPDGSFRAPTGYYTGLRRRPDGSFVERDFRGVTVEYAVPDGLGVARMTALADRHGNRMRFVHNARGQLKRVYDTLGRPIDYFYSPEGRLIAVRDFIGRMLRFRYDSNGDLVEVTSPAVTGTPTPNGNDFPHGRTTRYAYSSGFQDARLNHNLVSVTAPNEVATGGPPRIVIAYDTVPGSPTVDRVSSQTLGGVNRTGVPAGGTIRYQYRQAGSPAPGSAGAGGGETAVSDRNGNLRVYGTNAAGNIVSVREYTNRDLRLWEPEFYETRYEYNPEGELLRQINPEGNAIEYAYDQNNPDRFQQGNLVAVMRRPDARRGGDQEAIETRHAFEPIYNKVRSITEPRGTDANYEPQNGGAHSAARYTTVYTFDYQEGENYGALAERLGLGEAEARRLLREAGVPMALGDINGDGITNRIDGTIIRIEHPSVRLLADANQARRVGETVQAIVKLAAYNRFGQVVKEIDPEGNVTLYQYYPENDPDGDGRDLTSGMGTGPFGYLELTIRDAASAPDRNSGTNPAPTAIRDQLRYDRVGNVIRMVDGRGIATDYVVNQLNETMQVVRAAAHGLLTPEPPEPATLSDFRYLERYFYDFNGNVGLKQIEDRGNTSGVGGNNGASGTSFVDHVYLYDILDNQIEERVEVGDNEQLVTRHRYDANGNRVLTIQPEGNAQAWVYDERDLLFEHIRGATSPHRTAQLAAGDPPNYDVRGAAASTTTFHYDGNRNLIEVVDAADTDDSAANNSRLGGRGDRTRMIYDGFDRRSSVVDSVGNQAVRQYDPAGQVIRLMRFGPVGGESPSEDGPGKLRRPVSAGGVIQAPHLVNDRLLSASEYRYDEAGRPFQTDQVLFVNTIPTARVPDIVDGASDLGKGDLTPGDDAPIPGVAKVEILGRVSTRREYDRKGRVTFRVEDDGDVYRTRYDGADRVIERIDPEGNVVEAAYDDNDNLIETRETDVAQVQGVATETFLTTLFYDSLDRLLRRVDNIGRTYDYRYDSRDNLVAVSDAQGPEGPVVARRSFADGPLTINVTNRYGNVTRYFYDGINRRLRTQTILTASGEGDGSHIGATIEGVKSPTPHPDAAQGGGDGLIIVRFGWDRNSLLRSHVDDNGNQTRYAYDNLNRLVAESNGVCGPPRLADRCDEPTTVAQVFDSDDNVVRTVDENGSVIVSRFDAANRPVSRVAKRAAHIVGTTRITFQYDGLSRVTRLTDDNDPEDDGDDSIVTFAFDSLGRVLEEGQAIGPLAPKVVSSGWRAGALRRHVAYPNGRWIGYTYDGLDRPKRVGDGGTENRVSKAIATYDYIGTARLLRRSHPSNNTGLTFMTGNGREKGYDGIRRPLKFRHIRNDGSLIVGFEFSYDRMNNRRSELKLHAARESEVYRYDSAYRLISFERGALHDARERITERSVNRPINASWTLDGVGNWRTVDRETRQHSSFNEVTARQSSAVISRDHDNAGNTVDDGRYRYQWDFRNRLRRVTRKIDGALVASYAYDAIGRRIRKVVTSTGALGGLTDYYYDDWNVIEERDGNDALSRQYVHGIEVDEILVLDSDLNGNGRATDAEDRRFVYHQNPLLSVFALTNSDGDVVEGYHYDAYGRATVFRPGDNGRVDFGHDGAAEGSAGPNPDNPYLFTGRRFDAETALYNYRARYYDPSVGRFIHRDPISVWWDQRNAGNGYAYVANNPLNWTDPTGTTRKSFFFIDKALGTTGMALHLGGTFFTDLQDLVNQVSKSLKRPIDRRGKCRDCAQTITIVGHGAKGGAWFSFGPNDYVVADAKGKVNFSSPKVWKNLAALEKFMCNNGSIRFRQCRAGAGARGKAVLKKIAYLVGVRVSAPVGDIKMCAGGGTFSKWNTAYPPPYVRRGVCFVAGTLVSTPDGEVPIETLEVGDEVLSRDMETGKTGAYPITALIRDHRADLCDVRMVDGDSVTASTNHRFFVVGKGWTEAMELNRGDLLLMQGGAHIRVDGRVCRVETNSVPVFNLTVGVAHTYFVGPQRILVHNRKLR